MATRPSAGIFVVDPGTLALLDRWDPDAQYFAVQPIDDGSIVVAAGAPAVDADGNDVPWQASLTFHDATDGRILARVSASSATARTPDRASLTGRGTPRPGGRTAA